MKGVPLDQKSELQKIAPEPARGLSRQNLSPAPGAFPWHEDNTVDKSKI